MAARKVMERYMTPKAVKLEADSPMLPPTPAPNDSLTLNRIPDLSTMRTQPDARQASSRAGDLDRHSAS